MKFRISLIVAKILILIGKIVKRGSVLPGNVAMKICPNIVSKFIIDAKIIVVTGTTGKSTTTTIIANILNQAGYKVAHNLKGSNMTNGIVTNLIENTNLKGKITKDFIVWEVDERYLKQVFKEKKPDYLVITNLARDQLARNGHVEIVFNDIKKIITDDIHLLLNIDDPVVNKFSFDYHGKLTLFGITKNKLSYKKMSDRLDLLYCPKCFQKLNFKYFQYDNLGQYKCSKCDFERTNPDFEVTKIDFKKNIFKINKKYQLKTENGALYDIYNKLAAFTLLKEVGISEDKLVSYFDNLKIKSKSLNNFEIDGRKGVVLTSKNETPISYNQSLHYINNNESEKTVIIGFNEFSRRYSKKDLSWLYDVEFESLNSKTIKNIVCVGPYAYDIATRIKYAGYDEKKIIIEKDPEKLINVIRERTKGDIYAVLYFDLVITFNRLLGGMK